MNFLNRCNGFSSPRIRFSEAAYRVFLANVNNARDALVREFDPADARWGFSYEGHDYYLGSRWSDDRDVVCRIESAMHSEAEFLADPFSWCVDALRDCASSDHWYAFEKDWG